MAAILGQYNFNADTDTVNFSTPLTNITPCRMKTASSDVISNFDFIDEGLKSSTHFIINTSYFCRAQVKMLDTEQEFEVFLLGSADDDKEKHMQYVSTIKVPKLFNNNSSKYYEIRVVFSPLRENYDTILFKLKRTAVDLTRVQIYHDGYQAGATPDEEIKLMRYPIFIYQELSSLNSLCKNSENSLPSQNIIKIGIQGQPGAEFCINNERIMLNRTGIYEITHGAIIINSVSAIFPFVDNAGELASIQEEIENSDIDLENVHEIKSRVAFSDTSARYANSFSIDYMY